VLFGEIEMSLVASIPITLDVLRASLERILVDKEKAQTYICINAEDFVYLIDVLIYQRARNGLQHCATVHGQQRLAPAM
jgi:hypothetical protein